jgi:hypothetical protein
MPDPLVIATDPVTLATLGEGTAEEQFQAFVQRFLSISADETDNEGTYSLKDGCVVSKAKLEVTLTRSMETGITEYTFATTETHPGRKGGRVLCRPAGDGLVTERDGKQVPMFDRKRRNDPDAH